MTGKKSMSVILIFYYLGMKLISKNSKYKIIIGDIRMYPACMHIFAILAMILAKIETGQSTTLV